jgi:hypothetical protein
VSRRCTDISGLVFGEWTVAWPAGRRGKSNSIHYLAACRCGSYGIVAGCELRAGRSRNCGCQRNEDGRTRREEYESFRNAKQRCVNPKRRDFGNYGGRGIEFRFKSFNEFIADIGPRPSAAHSIDRINVNGHYERGNIRWATPLQQAHNKRER